MNFDRWATSSSSNGEVWKGLLAGALGGFVASWVMSQFQAQVPAKTFAKLLGETQADEENGGSQGDDEDPATVEAASAISEGVFDHALTEKEKKVAGPGVHYALGVSAGALYGSLAEVVPEVEVGAGLGFGTVFWLASDEVAVPAVGLSAPPWEHPPSTHVYALASHLVYGLTTELVRRAIRAVL